MAFLEFNSISKGYPGVQALSNVSLGVEKGAVHGLMGENGAGKSTLIRVLSGDQSADEGSILIDGVEQKYSSVRDAFHAGVIVIHQELQLVPELTVAENLWLGRFPGKAGVINGKTLIETVRARPESWKPPPLSANTLFAIRFPVPEVQSHSNPWIPNTRARSRNVLLRTTVLLVLYPPVPSPQTSTRPRLVSTRLFS